MVFPLLAPVPTPRRTYAKPTEVLSAVHREPAPQRAGGLTEDRSRSRPGAYPRRPCFSGSASVLLLLRLQPLAGLPLHPLDNVVTAGQRLLRFEDLGNVQPDAPTGDPCQGALHVWCQTDEPTSWMMAEPAIGGREISAFVSAVFEAGTGAVAKVAAA